MYAKLALRNIRRSLRDYIIYFVTLTLTAALMYSFLALGFSSDVLAMAENMSMLTTGILLMSALVAFMSSFVIGYAIRFMPPIAVFTLCWQIALGGQLGPAVATALFALSLPMQGLWWLGKRSVTPLPPAILNWFYEVRGKLQESGQVLAPVEGKPDYQALADTLKRAFKQLDKTFLDDL